MVMLYLPDERVSYWVGEKKSHVVPSYSLQVPGTWTQGLFSSARHNLLYELTEKTTRKPVKIARVHKTISKRGEAFDFTFRGLSGALLIGPVGLGNLLWYQNEAESHEKLEGIELQLHLMADGQRFGLSHPASEHEIVPYNWMDSPVKSKKKCDDGDDEGYDTMGLPFCGGEADGPVPLC
ncbi:MAG: hypothetical protein AABX10_02585 [Nanoarchaeota archaeon]